MCLSLQNAIALWLSGKQSGYFSGTPYIALAESHLGMTIVVKSKRGEELSTAWCTYRNDSICWLEETKGHVTLELDVQWGCVSKLQCERHVLPLLHSEGWQKVASATSFLKSVDCVLQEASRTGQHLSYECMLSLNLPMRKSCLINWLLCSFGLWVCTSLHCWVYRYVLGIVAANTDDLIVAPLTNIDFAIPPLGKSSGMTTHFQSSLDNVSRVSALGVRLSGRVPMARTLLSKNL